MGSNDKLKGDWAEYSRLVMTTLGRLEQELAALRDAQTQDKAYLISKIEQLRSKLHSDVIALNAQLKVKDLESQIEQVRDNAKSEALETKVDTRFNSFSKLGWLIVGGTVGTGFAIVQALGKFLLGLVGGS